MIEEHGARCDFSTCILYLRIASVILIVAGYVSVGNNKSYTWGIKGRPLLTRKQKNQISQSAVLTTIFFSLQLHLSRVSIMSSNLPISTPTSNLTAPTPQNTPLTHAPISAGLSRPTVPDIQEDVEGSGEDAEEVSAALQSGAAQSVLAGLVQSRLSSLVGRSSGYIESLPVEVKRSIAGLQGVQVKQTELQNQFKREVWELEKKVRVPFYLVHL